jgi:hypothetical protein
LFADYITWSKVCLIHEAAADFKDLYDIKCNPFTRKQFFYFITHDNKKYIHKRSLQFVYTNADTYTSDIRPNWCDLKKKIEPCDIIAFLESYTGDLLPKLIESNKKFLVYEYWNGIPIDSIEPGEFAFLKHQHEQGTLTPFYNSMCYNLVRGNDGTRLVDFKHFEFRDSKPFFLYFYNDTNAVNTLYIEADTPLESIIEHLRIDYPILDAKIVRITC